MTGRGNSTQTSASRGRSSWEGLSRTTGTPGSCGRASGYSRGSSGWTFSYTRGYRSSMRYFSGRGSSRNSYGSQSDGRQASAGSNE